MISSCSFSAVSLLSAILNSDGILQGGSHHWVYAFHRVQCFGVYTALCIVPIFEFSQRAPKPEVLGVSIVYCLTSFI